MSTPTPRTDAEVYAGLSSFQVDADFARALEREVSQLTDALDMMRAEFQRIIACPGCNGEIEDLATRAQLKLLHHVPVIVQRNKAEMALARERAAVRVLREHLELLAYWSRDMGESRITLRDRIRAALAATEDAPPKSDQNAPKLNQTGANRPAPPRPS